jgi:hypothetical protein
MNRNILRTNGNKSITNKLSNVTEKGKEIASAVKERAQNVVGKVQNTIKETTNRIPYNAIQSGNDFIEANSAISKFVFIIVLLFAFAFFFNLGVWVIQYLLGSEKNPVLLNGMVSANKNRIISVNPNVKGSVPLYRSVNEDQGLEFTWNIWFYVDSLHQNRPTYSRIFSKGPSTQSLNLKVPSNCTDSTCKNIFNSSPGLFITQNRQTDAIFPNTTLPTTLDNRVNLILLLNTFKPSQSNNQFAESITIENVPMQKWVCTTIRVQQTTVDIYINGVMTQRKKLNNLPLQNYYDVMIGDSLNGFTGSISSLRYFNKAINYDEIQSLFGEGPNLKSLESNGISPNGVDYISMNWYYK